MANTYTTQQGETWDLIALREMGNEKYMSQLIQANYVHRETVIFSAGIDLVIPQITTPIPTTLPPWKR
ncbi:MAG TPA: tail protein X [Syntrophomonadaceae bacterium]|nr:tail protein X [Syntrophomonadaceae bacterium]